MQQTNLSYNEWLDYAFDRPLPAENAQDWYFGEDEKGEELAWWRPD